VGIGGASEAPTVWGNPGGAAEIDDYDQQTQPDETATVSLPRPRDSATPLPWPTPPPALPPEDIMSATSNLSFINSQVAAGGHFTDKPNLVRRAVTISRQAGCGAQIVADLLAARLQSHRTEIAEPWTVFDRNLMEKVLEEHKLPKYLANYLPEDRISALEDMIKNIFGLHPPQETIVKQTAETILGLAELGNAILIGRGGNITTAILPHVLHVRLVAPLGPRIEHVCQDQGLTPAQAREFCQREDLGRERYLKKYFQADINDPVHYHLVINTALIKYDLAARLIEEALLRLG
jgi:cytidylate kinase